MMWFKSKIKTEAEKSDAAKREQLLAAIAAQQLESDVEPVVSLKDFFVGNQDYGSIGCNLNSAIAPQRFYQQLKDIGERPEVQEIWVEISYADGNEFDPLEWPFSDRIYLLSSASPETMVQWLAPLQPDEIATDHISRRLTANAMGSELRIYRVWWD